MTLDLAHRFRALGHAGYRRYFAGQGLSMIGTWMQQVAMRWLVYRLTGSAWLLGVVAFCGNAGILLFGTVSGVVADRVDRRRAIYVTQSLLALQAVTLAVVVGTGVSNRGTSCCSRSGRGSRMRSTSRFASRCSSTW